MTRNKFNKLVKGLIDKYGDVVVVEVYDYYKSQIILKEGEESSDNVLSRITLSSFIDTDKVVPNRATIENLEGIAKGKIKAASQPVVVEESKKLYDSEEQVELRKKRQEEFQQLFGTYALMNEPRVMHDLQMIQKFEDWTQTSPSPKEYGKYLSNK